MSLDFAFKRISRYVKKRYDHGGEIDTNKLKTVFVSRSLHFKCLILDTETYLGIISDHIPNKLISTKTIFKKA